jgi:hypothetical protein
MLRNMFFVLLLLSLSSAIIIGPRVYEQKDFGDPSLDDFTYSLSVDCEAAEIKILVMDESYTPLEKVNTYLKYIDFASPLVASNATGKDGFSVLTLPGNVSLMRGLFILVLEKNDSRNKEVHFDILGCLTNQTYIPPPPPAKPAPPPTKNYTKPPVQQENKTEKNETPLINITKNDSGVQEPAETDTGMGVVIPVLVVLLAGALAIYWVLRGRKR